MRYIIAPSSLAGRGLGVGFLYLTQPITAIAVFGIILLKNLTLKSLPVVDIAPSRACMYLSKDINYKLLVKNEHNTEIWKRT